MSQLQKMQADLDKAPTVREAMLLPFVKDRFIKNYEAITGRKDGENRFANEMFHYLGMCEENSKLKNCKKFSHFAALIKAGATGLSFTKEGQLYPIPYGDIVKVQIGAHGKRELMRRMPTVKDVLEAQIVWKDDEFVVDKLNAQISKHESKPPKSFTLDQIVATYCRILYKDKTHVDVIAWHDEIVKAMQASKNKGEGSVWVAWPGEMAKKVSYNRAYKLYYRVPEVEVLDLKEYEDDTDDTTYVDVSTGEVKDEAPEVKKDAAPESKQAVKSEPAVADLADDFLKD